MVFFRKYCGVNLKRHNMGGGDKILKIGGVPSPSQPNWRQSRTRRTICTIPPIARSFSSSSNLLQCNGKEEYKQQDFEHPDRCCSIKCPFGFDKKLNLYIGLCGILHLSLHSSCKKKKSNFPGKCKFEFRKSQLTFTPLSPNPSYNWVTHPVKNVEILLKDVSHNAYVTMIASYLRYWKQYRRLETL